jgi:hypothetical protein
MISIGDLGGGLVALEWVAHDTNTGPFQTVHLPRVGKSRFRERASFS